MREREQSTAETERQARFEEYLRMKHAHLPENVRIYVLQKERQALIENLLEDAEWEKERLELKNRSKTQQRLAEDEQGGHVRATMKIPRELFQKLLDEQPGSTFDWTLSEGARWRNTWANILGEDGEKIVDLEDKILRPILEHMQTLMSRLNDICQYQFDPLQWEAKLDEEKKREEELKLKEAAISHLCKFKSWAAKIQQRVGIW